MTDSFDTRAISSVFLRDIQQMKPDDSGTWLVTATVDVTFVTRDGGPDGAHLSFPAVTVEASLDDSMGSIQQALLGRAITLAKRLSLETPGSLHEAYLETWNDLLERDGSAVKVGPVTISVKQ